MRINFINNDGAGYGGKIEVAEGITVSQLFSEKMPGRNPSQYVIRVNGRTVADDYQLRADDAVSFTVTKMAGA